MIMSDPITNTTLFNFSFMRSRPPQPPWIITMSESYRISLMVCCALNLILSVLGNTSIIAIVARNPSMQSTINYLIANMAASDLASSLVVTGTFLSILHKRATSFGVSGALGNILCKLIPYIADVAIAVSIQSMVAIAFDRFFAVVFPMRPTPRLLDLRILLPIIWCLSLGTFTVNLVNFRLITIIDGVQVCIGKWPAGVDTIKAETIFYFSILTVFWLIPLTTIAILYTIIALKIRSQTIPGQQSPEAEETRRKQKKNIAKMAFAIVFFFFCCWFLFHVLVIMNLLVWKGNIPNDMDPRLFSILWDITAVILCLSFVISPYICFAFSSKFRKCFRNLFPFSICFATRIGPTGASSQDTSTTGNRAMDSLNRNTSNNHNENESKSDSL